MVVSQFAAEYFSNALWNTPRGNSVGLGYFKERGFSEESVRKFGLGWCPNEQKGVCHAALQAGYKRSDCLRRAGECREMEAGAGRQILRQGDLSSPLHIRQGDRIWRKNPENR